MLTFFERETGRVYLDLLYPSWIIYSKGFARNPRRALIKRSFDIATSALLLAMLWPIMLITALAIKLEDGLRAPVFYKQQRVGLDGEIFEVLKFRSMREDAEKESNPEWAQKNDPRVTRVGNVIRKLRIDELPQLLNVLSGDMAFVGPRPERPEFVGDFAERIPYYNERHCVKPGITGWAQLSFPYGSSENDTIEKLQFDLFYLKNHSLLFDLQILMQTVEVVLFGKGAR